MSDMGLIFPHKVSKQNVHYRHREVEKQCSKCAMWTQIKKGEPGVCDLVEGPIEPHDVCDRYIGRSFEAT
jgi:hypothetical protein